MLDCEIRAGKPSGLEYRIVQGIINKYKTAILEGRSGDKVN